MNLDGADEINIDLKYAFSGALKGFLHVFGQVMVRMTTQQEEQPPVMMTSLWTSLSKIQFLMHDDEVILRFVAAPLFYM